MTILGTSALRLIIPVLLLQLPRLPCFKFTKEPQSPIILVLGHNTTNVDMEWTFEAEGSTIASWKVKRFLKNKDSSLSKETDLAYFSPSLKLWNRTLYIVDSSFATPGYANFTIKDVLKRADNADKTKVSSLSGDVYSYRLEVDTAPPSSMNLVTKKSSLLELQVYFPSSCEIHPDRNITVDETDNVSLNVITTGNPPVYEYIWTHPNGSRLTANSTLTFTASRLDTGTYNVSVYNGVGDRSYCTRHVIVQFPSSCTIHPDATTVNETDKVSLNVTTTGYPRVYEYIWTHPNGSRLTANSRLTFTASRQDTGTYKVSVYNGVGDRGICTSNVTVQYFDEPDICKNQTSILINRTQYTLNVTGNPRPSVTCRLGKNKTSQSYTSDEKGTFEVTFFSNNVELICEISGKAGKCNFTLYKEIPATTWNFTFTITNKNLRTKRRAIEDINLKTITAILRDIYQEKPYFKDVKVLGFVQGNAIVNFQLIVVGAAADYLQPLKNAVIEKSPKLRGLIIDLNSIQNGLFAPTTSPTTGIKITTLSTEPTTSPTLTDAMIIVIVVVVVVLLIFIIMVIVCYCKKKRQKDKKKCVVEEVVVVTDGARDNDGYSPSQYAHHGPSHIDPAYDSVEVRKGAKNKNDNQTKSGGEKGGPTYAAVDKIKKNKRKKPDEVTYASLADTQPPGGRGGIVLEPLRKGQHTKMPDKYEETTYAKIVGTKKPASGNQNAAGASNNIPLADMHGQGAETESKPSDQTADPAKQNDHKPATNKKEKPPDNQGQPPTKEDSGKEESNSAESSVTKLL